jgi:hypothetical protein
MLFKVIARAPCERFVITGGCERTKSQYESLLKETNFKLTSIASTSTALSIIEARPV